ncbi:MAG TPA: DUF6797 domain-containing protein [Tepidisphaeraceae bacterium]|nr:DUF6797 domain-containing protein [Tepidisphaeraceae bacterium]
MKCSLLAALLLVVVMRTDVRAADAGDPAEAPPVAGGKGKGATMDYGPFLQSSLRGPGPKGAVIADRAITIKLEGGAYVAFDTETMRVAAAWTGDWLDLSKSHLTSPKGSAPPAIAGKVMFTTPAGPGWSHDGSFEDPRKGAPGPLPREHAKYVGLYVAGGRPVISYTVGAAIVSEVFEAVPVGDRFAIVRSISVDGAAKPLSLVVASAAPGLDVALEGAPAGTKLSTESGAVRVALPAGAAPVTFAVRVTDADGKAAGPFVPRDARPLITSVVSAAPAASPVQGIETVGVLGKPTANFPYVVDTLTLPFENPHGSWMRVSAVDFFDGGNSAAVATWNGDVWVVSGITEGLEKLTWRRFASGLYEPLGVKILRGQMYVLGRDQITQLHDVNGDGLADIYQNHNNDGACEPQYHHFKMDLDADAAGNLYYTAGGAWNEPRAFASYNAIVKVATGGKTSEVIARGIRAANGMAVGPKGEIVFGDNQGHWVPTSKINFIPPGKTDGFYGFPYDPRVFEPKDAKEKAKRQAELKALYPAGIPTTYEPPLCWVPYAFDTSSGGQAFVPAGDTRWGPFGGHIVHTSYGKSSLFLVLHETVASGGKAVVQGGVLKFPLTFEAGIMRPRFNPGDGQLYVAGLRGWQTAAAKDGCLHRVRYTGGGAPAPIPSNLRATRQGIYLTFATPLDPATANDAGSFDVEQWNYLWSSAYGSPEFSAENKTKKGKDTVEVASAKLQPDGRTVFLAMPEIRTVMQMSITYKLKAAGGGGAVEGAVYNTINALAEK